MLFGGARAPGLKGHRLRGGALKTHPPSASRCLFSSNNPRMYAPPSTNVPLSPSAHESKSRSEARYKRVTRCRCDSCTGARIKAETARKDSIVQPLP